MFINNLIKTLYEKNFRIGNRLCGELYFPCTNGIGQTLVLNGYVTIEVPGRILIFFKKRNIKEKSWCIFKGIHFNDAVEHAWILSVTTDEINSFNFKAVIPNSLAGSKLMLCCKHIAPVGCSWAPASTCSKFKVQKLKISGKNRALQPALF